MVTTTIRLKTTIRYHGLEVTITGDVGTGLLAIAGYGTPQELAIATIAVKRRRGRRVYCVAGSQEWTASAATVAQAAVRARHSRDARVRLTHRQREG
ncbi:MAG: hypothetical protein QOD69_1179 [Solirubrobacteraceae bacterium]|jgi:hypothetical protein|nr:hypothetical protein [Solirubrobacteraceae bacterium]